MLSVISIIISVISIGTVCGFVGYIAGEIQGMRSARPQREELLRLIALLDGEVKRIQTNQEN